MFCLKNIVKTYNKGKSNEYEALHGISMEVKDAELTAIIGTSGAGKSTLLHILACIDGYDSGEYTIDGEDVGRISEKQMARVRNEKIGMVMQDFALIEGSSHNPSFICEEYMEDHLTVICPANGQFQPGQEISIHEFCQQNFLLREHGSGTRETFENTIAAAGFSIEPIWEAVSTTALVNAVSSGIGISILPHRMIADTIQQGQVIAVTVKGLEFKRKFNIIYHQKKFLTAAARSFIELCRSQKA